MKSSTIDQVILAETVILIIIMIFIILGNMLVLVATWREKSLHQPNKYFTACLAVADLLVGVIVAPIRSYQLLNYGNGGITSIQLCRFYIWIDAFAATASIYTLTLISYDRYLKISKPLHYKSRITSSRTFKLIFLIWLISLIYATLTMFPYSESRGIIITPAGCINENKVFHTFVVLSAFFAPTIAILVMYALIFIVAHKRQIMLRNGDLSETSNGQNQIKQQSGLLHDLKVIRMLSLVAGAFIFCWGPFFIWWMVTLYSKTDTEESNTISTAANMYHFKVILWKLVVTLPIANSLVNPFVYTYFDLKYRKAFKQCFQQTMCRENSRPEPLRTQ